MSVSDNCSDPIDLYCNESATDLASTEAEIGEVESISSNFQVEDESYIDSLFDSELDQILKPTGFLEFQEISNARQDAVNWMLKVHEFYRFKPQTAYLAVNYLDRFLSFHTLQRGKGWPMNLLAVACLSIAAKLEETSIPLLLDLQILEPRFLFKPITVQRMEVLVMSRLKWRLRVVTPFHFLPHFIENISCLSTDCNSVSNVFSRSSDLIISFCREMNLLDYSPSAIAAATVIWVTKQTLDDPKFGSFHERLCRDMVKSCYNLIKKKKSELLHNKAYNETIPTKCNAKKFPMKELKTSHSLPPNKC